ncbi:MAG: FIST C-terminal domain-containing protein [Rhodocyclaceae bacterium]|nr:FIST C-terminal domain-containing protein [Rhodocyclaceae bacterium]MBX3670369.1 FIST C-terminal domain-containing protein [Rhodocyclaceae bacterium]
MKIQQVVLKGAQDVESGLAQLGAVQPQMILAFGAPQWFADAAFVNLLCTRFSGAKIAGCSTAGEISADGVSDSACVLTGVSFDKARFSVFADSVADIADSTAAGKRLGASMQNEVPDAVLLFAPGVDINGTALVDGLAACLPAGVRIVGGLAGDGSAFRSTWTLSNSGAAPRTVVAVALYAGIKLAHGSFGGWKPFGPARRVTRCDGSILYELDGEPALDVYKRYLGDHARDLPASGLLFPFEMLDASHRDAGLIRTIVGIDEAQGSLLLAGAVDADGFLRLMHASTDGLVDGAHAAAEAARDMLAAPPGEGLALLVSCVGRKLVMGGRAEEEVEAVGDVLGARATLAGFYSYGEISPFLAGTECKLHNQTMTVSYLAEAA